MSTSSSKKYKLIGLLFLALYVMIHLGFYKTYFIHFPSFKKFQLLHHVHGFLMSTWILMLITQPLLIGYGKVKLHHFVGGLSYVIAPLLVVSLFLITKMSYEQRSLIVVAKRSYCRSGFEHRAAFHLLRILCDGYGIQEECCPAHAVHHRNRIVDDSSGVKPFTWEFLRYGL